MNKSITSLFALASSAMIASAAQINWQSSSAFTNDGQALSGNVVVLLMMDKGAAAPDVSYDGETLTGGTYYGQSSLGSDGKLAKVVLAISGNWAEGTITVAGGAAYGNEATIATTGSGTANQKDYYMAIFDSSSLTAESKYTLVSLASKAPTSQTGSLTLAFAGADLKDATWAPVGVPEPTTVALLTLGLAAVGLKRKVA